MVTDQLQDITSVVFNLDNDDDCEISEVDDVMK